MDEQPLDKGIFEKQEALASLPSASGRSIFLTFVFYMPCRMIASVQIHGRSVIDFDIDVR